MDLATIVRLTHGSALLVEEESDEGEEMAYHRRVGGRLGFG
jgi:hypothetical protein